MALDAASPKLKESTYEIAFNGLEIERADLDRFLQSEVFPVVKEGKKRQSVVDLRILVKSMDILESGTVRLVIQHTTGPELKPAEIVRSVFHVDEADIRKIAKMHEVVN